MDGWARTRPPCAMCVGWIRAIRSVRDCINAPASIRSTRRRASKTTVGYAKSTEERPDPPPHRPAPTRPTGGPDTPRSSSSRQEVLAGFGDVMGRAAQNSLRGRQERQADVDAARPLQPPKTPPPSRFPQDDSNRPQFRFNPRVQLVLGKIEPGSKCAVLWYSSKRHKGARISTPSRPTSSLETPARRRRRRQARAIRMPRRALAPDRRTHDDADERHDAFVRRRGP